MKIICITSSEPGHIDFGGRGFITLGKALETRGHHVRWLTFGSQADRLRKVGCAVESHSEIRWLSLMPFFTIESIENNKEKHQRRLNSLKKLYMLFNEEQPDLLLIDRLLTYGPMLAEQLHIPYVAIGTPGGYWQFKRNNKAIDVFPAAEPVEIYRHYSETLKNELGWEKGKTESFWANSPYLNVCFMPKGFYPIKDEHKVAQVCVYHHNGRTIEKNKKRIGVSFGNQGSQDVLTEFLEHAVALQEIELPIDVFVGTNEATFKKLHEIYNTDQITLHKWVDFDHYFQRLSCLVFLGGVGTIWRCINNGLPMIIIPGDVGDQKFNAERVDTMGAGIHLHKSDIKSDKIANAVSQCLTNMNYSMQVAELKAASGYSTTMDGVCGMIESKFL